MAISDKLTYLNETKTLLKNKINLTGANITTDTFRQYPTKLQNALLECWNNEGEPIFTNWGTKVNGEGTNVKLDNTINARMKITPKGNTTQTGTPTPSSPIDVNVVSGDNEIDICGKNLFNNEKITRGSAYSYGTTGSVPTSSGSNARATISPTNSIKVLPSTTYTLSFPISGFRYALGQMDSGYISLGDSGWKTNTTYSFTTNATTNYIGFNFSKTDNSTISDSEWGTLKNGTIQLEKGSPTTYEAYIGNTYPLYLGVENLFDGEIELGSIDPANGSLVSNNSRTRSKNFLKVKPNTTYTFKREVGENRWIVGYTSSKVGITDGNFNNKASAIRSIGVNDNIMTFTTTSTTEYIKWYDTNSTDLTENVIIELGSHIQYVSSTPIELNKIGTYQDYIFKNGSKWYLHKEVGKVVLNGSENWQIFNTNMYLYIPDFILSAGNNDYVPTNFIADHFTPNSLTNSSANLNASYMIQNVWGSRNNQRGVAIKTNDTFTDLATLKTWLGNNNTKVYYQLDTPIETEITNTTLINQLENLKGAMSYEGQTNISSGFMIIGASALGELE